MSRTQGRSVSASDFKTRGGSIAPVSIRSQQERRNKKEAFSNLAGMRFLVALPSGGALVAAVESAAYGSTTEEASLIVVHSYVMMPQNMHRGGRVWHGELVHSGEALPLLRRSHKNRCLTIKSLYKSKYIYHDS